jgi:hypothetical protein
MLLKSYRKKSIPDGQAPRLLNEEEIAARRIPLEDAEVKVAKHGNWHCHYCDHRFTNEGTFMKHHCEPKRRAQELSSPLGQAAYGYYRDWMKLRRFSQPGAAAFMESKYYRSFINFSQLVISANISRPDKYMEIMVAGEILPVLWCRDSAYALYLDWADKLSDPLDQVQDSINYLLDICERESVELKNIFTHLGVQRVLSLIRQRRLSPWFLFCSSAFGTLLRTLDKSELIAFNGVVNAAYWGNRFQTEKATVESVKMIIRELGL